MVNEKETRAPEGLRRSSQMCESTCMKKTDDGAQKFEFLALFFDDGKIRRSLTKLPWKRPKLSAPLVSEKAQHQRRFPA
jgi:hypothetical protein